MQQQYYHQGSSSVGVLRRSRTLHHRPPPQEYRRRASHPASPSYCAATLHYCGGVAPQNVLPPGLPEEGELEADAMASRPAGMSLSPQQHPAALGHIRGATNNNERCYDNSGQIARNDWWHSQERGLMPEPTMAEREREMEWELEQKRQMQKEKELEREAKIQEEKERERQQELERSRAGEQQPLLSHVHPPQAGDVNDTWPKPASRQSHGVGGGRGLYSTLEGYTGAGTSVGCDNKGHMSGALSPNLSSGLQPKLNPSYKPSVASRVTRSQLLRDRASQLADERSGMSTDEETSTDMLRGRYWSRTERKEHFLLAREQRQQQLLARGLTARDGVVGRGGASFGDGGALESRGVGPFAEGRCNTVLELSQRKLSRLRNRKLLDDWTTVEELLTHGTRLDNQGDRLCPSSLLTVTTV